MSESKNIAVMGAGLMGHGIALVFARQGHNVIVHDPHEKAMQSLHDRIRQSMNNLGADNSNIDFTINNVLAGNSLSEAVVNADFVFEAAPENLELKQTLFENIEQAAPEQCVLASNTSVMPISSIMQHLEHKERAVGTHWWNPPHLIPLVEVIRTQWTNVSSVDSVFNLLADAGKSPVRVEKDVPGFIGNRLQHALWREAISLVENGICTADAVDLVVKESFGRRLAVLGPLENADLVGTDLTLAIHEQVLHDLERSDGPSPKLKELVNTGKLGMKSGEGFQQWSSKAAENTTRRVSEHLLALEKILP